MRKTTTTRASLALIALLAGAFAGACAHGRDQAASGPCDDFDLDVERVWSSDKRREIRSGLEAFAGESQQINVDRIITKMDDIASDWVMMNRRACKDTVERETMPEEIYVRVSLCLNTALVQQRTLVSALEGVDRTSYEHIDRAMLEISEQISTCQNQAVLAYYKQPEETVDAEAAKLADDKTAEARTLLALGKSDAASKLLGEAGFAAEKSGDERRKIDAKVASCHHSVMIGDYEQALGQGRPALTAAQKLGYAIGEADALTCIGTAELRAGNYIEARRDLEAALGQREAFFGAEHPRVADAANRLGNLEVAMANYRAAHDLYMRALDIWTDTFGADDPITSRAYHNLGYTHIGLEDIEGAAAWYKKAISAETKSLGPDHPATALSEASYADVLLIQERADEAYELLNHAVEVQERILGPGHPEVAVSYQGIGDVWAARKGWDTALEWYQKALTLRRLALGDNHLDTARTLDAMAIAYYRLKKLDDALKYATEAMEIRERLLGGSSIITATSYFNLGLIHEKRKAYRQALQWYEKSLEVEEAVRGVGHDLTKQTKQTVERLRDLSR
ncbi:tetratricopeptide repeat protein [Pseudenhygromyxa sp. WMMC2535]|uniref:tetratricopeptide repeat protein n=1 Tax=Pseudenhygromyxa sp. WMMC2535 TaxID=2712867 RepID=UPI001551AA17|nr:tetratricopeptide repeat protein [Pseudenhygromyxa sp. WMMC2535]NVB38015.1 tetratricopeptide repeat protein [Pseudenhygromyxa sp. WMMC2535]